MTSSDFDESQHPRGDGGKWVSKAHDEPSQGVEALASQEDVDIERAARAVLDNFHGPDDTHASWHLNPWTVAREVLVATGHEADDETVDACHQAVLDNFHGPDDTHASWHLNPYEVADAVLKAREDHHAASSDEAQSGECWDCNQVFADTKRVVEHVRTAHEREPRSATQTLSAEDRDKVTTVMRDAINGWYFCAAQATRFLSEETLNHPNDEDEAFQAATKRYVEDDARNNEVWGDELGEDEAMFAAKDALDRTTSGSKDALWETYGGGTEDEDELIQRALPTNDRHESARLIIEACQKLYGK